MCIRDRIVVDTCSLVMIAKNYLPLDKDGQLYSFLEEAFSRKDLMLLDAVSYTHLDVYKRQYKCCAIEDVEFPEESFDVILSSLAFHYVACLLYTSRCV